MARGEDRGENTQDPEHREVRAHPRASLIFPRAVNVPKHSARPAPSGPQADTQTPRTVPPPSHTNHHPLHRACLFRRGGEDRVRFWLQPRVMPVKTKARESVGFRYNENKEKIAGTWHREDENALKS